MSTDTAFLCRIWGEDIDHTLTAIVPDWEGVRRFFVDHYLNEEDHKFEFADKPTLDQIKDDFDEIEADQRGAYVENWEIGGMSIERIRDCTPKP